MSSSPLRNKQPPPFQQPWDRNEVASRMKEQKWRLSKSSVNFGGQECDWSTTLRPHFSSPGQQPPGGPLGSAPMAKAAGITYNAQTGKYKNSSQVSLGSDVLKKEDYVQAGTMPRFHEEYPDWQNWRGKKDEVFAGLIQKSSVRLGSDSFFYTKSTMREMLEDSAKHGFAIDIGAIQEQRKVNFDTKMRLRTSTLTLGPDKETSYFQANAMPYFSPETIIDNKKKSALDPTLAVELRRSKFQLGDNRIMEKQSVMRDQFPPLKNDNDWKGMKLKQQALVKQLRSTQFEIGDGSPVNYKRTNDMKDWSSPDTYLRPRTPCL